jgi:hypothetical protein
LNLLKSFQNRRVQIFCSYWTTDVSELRRELLKTGKEQPHRFLNPANRLPTNNGAISPVLKSFQQIKKLLALNG